MTATPCPESYLTPSQANELVEHLNALGQHVRNGNITPHEARILLCGETRPMAATRAMYVLTRIDRNLAQLLDQTPLESFTVRYDESKGDIALVFFKNRTRGSRNTTITI